LKDNLSLQLEGAKCGFVRSSGTIEGDVVTDHIEHHIGIGLAELEVLSRVTGLKVSVEVSVEVLTEEEVTSCALGTLLFEALGGDASPALCSIVNFDGVVIVGNANIS